MLSKKSIRIISIVILAVMLLMTMSSVVFAEPVGGVEVNANVDAVDANAKNLAATVLGYVKYVGIMIAVGMLIYMGIKYVTAAPDGKAQMKQQLTIYIIGFVFIVGATVVIGILESALKSATGAL